MYKCGNKGVIDYVIPLFNVGGSAFTNQPAGDGVEIVSAETADTYQLITVWYTDHTSGAITYETKTLNGTTQVALTSTNVGTVIGVYLGDIYGKNSFDTAGNITIREASGNATITTITAGNKSAGSILFRIPGRHIYLYNASGNTWCGEIALQSQTTYTGTLARTPSFKYVATKEDEFCTKPDCNAPMYLFFTGDTSGSTIEIQVLKD